MKIHVSEVVKNHLADDPRFECIERGLTTLKGKGEFTTYFVEESSQQIDESLSPGEVRLPRHSKQIDESLSLGEVRLPRHSKSPPSPGEIRLGLRRREASLPYYSRPMESLAMPTDLRQPRPSGYVERESAGRWWRNSDGVNHGFNRNFAYSEDAEDLRVPESFWTAEENLRPLFPEHLWK